VATLDAGTVTAEEFVARYCTLMTRRSWRGCGRGAHEVVRESDRSNRARRAACAMLYRFSPKFPVTND